MYGGGDMGIEEIGMNGGGAPRGRGAYRGAPPERGWVFFLNQMFFLSFGNLFNVFTSVMTNYNIAWLILGVVHK